MTSCSDAVEFPLDYGKLSFPLSISRGNWSEILGSCYRHRVVSTSRSGADIELCKSPSRL